MIFPNNLQKKSLQTRALLPYMKCSLCHFYTTHHVKIGLKPRLPHFFAICVYLGYLIVRIKFEFGCCLTTLSFGQRRQNFTKRQFNSIQFNIVTSIQLSCTFPTTHTACTRHKHMPCFVHLYTMRTLKFGINNMLDAIQNVLLHFQQFITSFWAIQNSIQFNYKLAL